MNLFASVGIKCWLTSERYKTLKHLLGEGRSEAVESQELVPHRGVPDYQSTHHKWPGHASTWCSETHEVLGRLLSCLSILFSFAWFSFLPILCSFSQQMRATTLSANRTQLIGGPWKITKNIFITRACSYIITST